MQAILPDFRCENRTEPVPLEPHRLTTDVDAALEQQILGLPEGERMSAIAVRRTPRASD